MKISQKNIETFINKPSGEIFAILVHGRDKGLIHERAETLSKGVTKDSDNPFCLRELSASNVFKNPGLLVDEALSKTLGGARGVVRLQLGSENISEALGLLLSYPKLENIVIVEAGHLAASSNVRRLMEKSEKTAVIACYEDSFSDRKNLVATFEKEHNLKIDSDARDYLISNIGSDRLVSRSELSKLALFLGKKKNVKLPDVAKIIGDTSLHFSSDTACAAMNGNHKKLSFGLNRSNEEGIPPMSTLNATKEHVIRLLEAQIYLVGGESREQSIKLLRPPVHFNLAKQLANQLGFWQTPVLIKALSVLTKAEIQCKTTGLPEKAIVERALISITQIAKTLLSRQS